MLVKVLSNICWMRWFERDFRTFFLFINVAIIIKTTLRLYIYQKIASCRQKNFSFSPSWYVWFARWLSQAGINLLMCKTPSFALWILKKNEKVSQLSAPAVPQWSQSMMCDSLLANSVERKSITTENNKRCVSYTRNWMVIFIFDGLLCSTVWLRDCGSTKIISAMPIANNPPS